jgi:hypothetical protein
MALAGPASGGVPGAGVQGLENTGEAVGCQHFLTLPDIEASRAAQPGAGPTKDLIWSFSASFPWNFVTHRVMWTPFPIFYVFEATGLAGLVSRKIDVFFD